MGRVTKDAIALPSALFAALFIVIAPLTNNANFFYGLSALCTSIAIFCLTGVEITRFFLSAMGLVVFYAGLFYLVHEIIEGKIFSSSRSEPSIFNACMFMLFIGFPSGIYALDTMLELRRDAA